MPTIKVVFYSKENGSAPVLDWLDSLVPKALDKCMVKIERLGQHGHEMRRPEADFLEDGVYELRIKHTSNNYRLLYFFHGSKAVVLSHGFLKKQAKVPKREIRIALERKKKYMAHAERHTYWE